MGIRANRPQSSERPRAAARPWGNAAAGPIVALALAIIGLSACTEPAPPSPTSDEYVAALGAICTETTGVLGELSTPPDAPGVSAFAAAVSGALRAEAEAARALAVPDELEPDHRAFIRNTDDQAARWERLSATASTDTSFSELTREIGELTLGRNDLSDELGIAACRRSTG